MVAGLKSRHAPSGNSGTRTPQAQPVPSITIYICRTRTNLLCIFVLLPASLSKVVISGFFIGPCHCSNISIPCLAFRGHVVGDLNEKYRSKQAFSRLR